MSTTGLLNAMKKKNGISAFTLAADYLDWLKPGSRRNVPDESLRTLSFRCVHPDCAGGKIRFLGPLHEALTEMAKTRAKTGVFSVGCCAAHKNTPSLACVAHYDFRIVAEYEGSESVEKPRRKKTPAG